MVLVHSSCPRQTGAGREKGEPTPEQGRLYIDRALRCCCYYVLQVSALYRHPHTCSELALLSSSSQFKFGASFFFSSSSSFALLQLLPPLRLLQLEVNILSPHLFLNDAHEFFSSTASRALISLCTPPSHSLFLSSFSLCRPLSVHSLCVFLFFFLFFGACFAQIKQVSAKFNCSSTCTRERAGKSRNHDSPTSRVRSIIIGTEGNSSYGGS